MPQSPDNRCTETAVGIDVGGTRMRAARIDGDGGRHGHVAEPVRSDRDGFVEQLLRLVAAVRDDTTTAVGIGIPGRVDPRSGAILSAGYLDVAGLDLPATLPRDAGLPCRVENDAAMALLAEARRRPEGAEGLILMITVGTGIGGAALQDGAPWYGGGFAGQFGHIAVADDGPRCNCGRRGCVETFSSGTALGRLLGAAGLPPDTRAETLLDRADAGDAVAGCVLDQWAGPLRRAIRSLVAMADPRLILIGGGLGAEMAAALARAPDRNPWFPEPVAAATLGDAAGVTGAGLRALDTARAGRHA